jgi:hypothetical protein
MTKLHANPNKKGINKQTEQYGGNNILAYEPLFSLYLQGDQ